MHIAPDSDIRPMYEVAPFPLEFRLRLFNITNKEEVIEGSELIITIIVIYTY